MAHHSALGRWCRVILHPFPMAVRIVVPLPMGWSCASSSQVRHHGILNPSSYPMPVRVAWRPYAEYTSNCAVEGRYGMYTLVHHYAGWIEAVTSGGARENALCNQCPCVGPASEFIHRYAAVRGWRPGA